MKFSRLLSRQTSAERHVITRLRSREELAELRNPELDNQKSGNQQPVFSKLAALMRANGAVIFTAASPFISESEVTILGLLAAAQRADQEALSYIGVGERDALRRCAIALSDLGISLPFRAMCRSLSITDKDPYKGESTSTKPCPSSPHGLGRNGASLSSARVRARALDYLHTCAVASTGELEAMGFSRQYLSLLCKGGYLQRVRQGWYRASPRQDRLAGGATMSGTPVARSTIQH